MTSPSAIFLRCRLTLACRLALASCSWLAAAHSLPAADSPLEETVVSGPVTATVALTPAEPLIGDPVTLTVTVRADKDVEVLMPDFGEALDRFSIIDFVPRESLTENGDRLAVQTYRLQPPRSGTQTIPPILIEYVDRRPGQREAPEGYDAYEVLTERIEFTVGSVLPDDAAAELEPPLGELQPLAPPAPSRWPWIAAGSVIFALATAAGIFGWLHWRRQARRRSAYDIAQVRLQKLLARPRPAKEQLDRFFVELSAIVRQYLEDRYELRAPELTTEEFLAEVGDSPDLSRDHQELLRQFLRQADLVKFAGAQPAGDEVENSIIAVQRFLDETRENSPLLEVEPLPSDPQNQTPRAANSQA